MLKKYSIVIADTSCFILLDKINELDILQKVFGTVTTTFEISRKLVNKLNLNYTGTLGVFLKAKEMGIIQDIRSILSKIQQTNFRFSEKVLKEILQEANEQ